MIHLAEQLPLPLPDWLRSLPYSPRPRPMSSAVNYRRVTRKDAAWMSERWQIALGVRPDVE